MNKHTTSHMRPSAHYSASRTPHPIQIAGRTIIPRWRRRILVVDGAFLLVAGLAALAADLAGYFFGAGPFAALAGQALALGAVEAHGLAALMGILI